MREKMLCKRVQINNGVVQVLFTLHTDFSYSLSQEKHVLINVPKDEGDWVEGKSYWVDVYLALDD